MASIKRALSLLLSFSMMLSLLTFHASAAGGPYTIQWKDETGKVLSAVQKSEGATYECPVSVPASKPGSGGNVLVFSGWEDGNTGTTYFNSFPKAEKNVTYTAQYEPQVRECEVVFVNYDGAELRRGTYDYGTAASAIEVPSTPRRPADEKSTYTFDGWEVYRVDNPSAGIYQTPTPQTVTGDVVYRAHYAETPRQYTITWKNGPATITTTTAKYGEVPTPPSAPTKASDGEYSYTFAGWNPGVTNATGDATYTAVFNKTALNADPDQKHTVDFVMDDGEKITTVVVKHGETPAAPEAPEKAPDARYSYTFDHWSPSVGPVTGDMTYSATFRPASRKYDVQWVNGDEVLDTDTTGYPYGTAPAYNGAKPTRDDTRENTYVFTGWEVSSDPTSLVTTAAAKFTGIPKQYPVAFTNDDGEVLQVRMEQFGELPTVPDAAPTKPSSEQYDFTFKPWDEELKPVEGPTTYTASYLRNERDYESIFVDDDGKTVLKRGDFYPYSTEFSAMEKPADPEKAGTAEKTFTFTGWQLDNVDTYRGQKTYKANYSDKTNLFTVTWLNSDGALLEQDEDVPYGATATYDSATPTKDPTNEKTYTFNGWDKEPGTVTNHVTYTATYNDAVRLYTVTWQSEDKVVATSELPYGATPSYNGPTLTKAEDNKSTYTWNKDTWTPAIVNVTGPATYNAVFDATPKEYSVDFNYEVSGAVNKTGLLFHNTYKYDELPVYEGPGTYAKPAMEDTEQYAYTFVSWDRAIDKVTGDTTYTARFTSALRKYTVRWLDGNGDPIETDYNVPYGDMPTFDSNPEAVTKTPNPDGTTYTWDGHWIPTVRPVEGEIDYTPSFDDNYPITWVDGDGNVLKTDDVPKGTTPEYTGEEPTKSPTEDTKFAWDTENGNNGWDKPQVRATGPATYTAQFKPSEYLITYVDENGDPIQEEFVPVDELPTPPPED